MKFLIKQLQIIKEYLDKLMNTVFANKPREVARRLFLFSYFCYGMSFIDMAYLKRDNIKSEGGVDTN